MPEIHIRLQQSQNVTIHAAIDINNKIILKNLTVKGIGEDKMFDIFYYANTDELNMTSNFKELKSACIRVATNKYGANTAEVQAVQKAFDAVKIK